LDGVAVNVYVIGSRKQLTIKELRTCNNYLLLGTRYSFASE